MRTNAVYRRPPGSRGEHLKPPAAEALSQTKWGFALISLKLDESQGTNDRLDRLDHVPASCRRLALVPFEFCRTFIHAVACA